MPTSEDRSGSGIEDRTGQRLFRLGGQAVRLGKQAILNERGAGLNCCVWAGLAFALLFCPYVLALHSAAIISGTLLGGPEVVPETEESAKPKKPKKPRKTNAPKTAASREVCG